MGSSLKKEKWCFSNFSEISENDRTFSRSKNKDSLKITDCCSEFLNKKNYTFDKFIKLSSPYIPEQTRIAERKHQHLIKTNTMLILPFPSSKNFLGRGMFNIDLYIPRLPSPNTKNISHFKLLCNRQLDHDYLQVFGSFCFTLLPSIQRDKFSSKSIECCF